MRERGRAWQTTNRFSVTEVTHSQSQQVGKRPGVCVLRVVEVSERLPGFLHASIQPCCCRPCVF